MLKLSGIMAPVFVPLNTDGSLNTEVIPQYAKYLASQGVQGVFVNGTAGEGMSLSVRERKIVAEVWVKSSKEENLAVVVMVGAGGLTDTKDLAEHAEKLGVDGIATLPCLYDKPRTVDDLVEYCYEVSLSAPNTPLLYYHIPFKTGVNIPMDEFLMSGAKKIKTLSGLKYTDQDVSGEGLKCLQLNDGKFSIFTGFDNKLSESFLAGYTCAITCGFNFIATEGKKVFQFARAAKDVKGKERDIIVERATDQQRRINEILDLIFSFTNGFSVAAAKAAMTILTGINVGPPRKPVRNLPQEIVEAMSLQLKRTMEETKAKEL